MIDEENFPGERRHGFGLRKNPKGTESEAALKEGTLFFANTIEEPTGKTDGPADDAGKGGGTTKCKAAPLWKPDFEAVVRNYLGSGLMTVSEVLVIVFPEL